MSFTPLRILIISCITFIPLFPIFTIVKSHVSREISWKQLLLLFLYGVLGTLIYLFGNGLATTNVYTIGL